MCARKFPESELVPPEPPDERAWRAVFKLENCLHDRDPNLIHTGNEGITATCRGLGMRIVESFNYVHLHGIYVPQAVHEEWTDGVQTAYQGYAIVGSKVRDVPRYPAVPQTTEGSRARCFIDIVHNIMKKTVQLPPGWEWKINNGVWTNR